jgi:heat shock protein HtpX
MNLFKRVGLFLVVNLLVIATLSVTMNLLGIAPYLTAKGINYQTLLLFCVIWGFGGAFISLALSRVMAKWMMGVKVLDPTRPGQSSHMRLVMRVEHFSRAAGLPVTPEVGVYESPEPNAFATGPTKSRALVAVSTGLLDTMSDQEIDGVIAHEVAHIANGDMVTMTLVQGVINAFVMFFARIAAWAISQSVREEMRGMVNMGLTILFDIMLSILGSVVVAAFSRHREFRADAGAASIAGREPMIAALEALRRHTTKYAVPEAPAAVAALRIAGQQGGLLRQFASHPPLEERIRRLRSPA